MGRKAIRVEPRGNTLRVFVSDSYVPPPIDVNIGIPGSGLDLTLNHGPGRATLIKKGQKKRAFHS
jgi:hypothetical protein